MKPEDPDKLMTPGELAGRLRLSRTTIYRHVELRTIGHLKIGGAVRFTRQHVADFLATVERKPRKRRKAGKRKQPKTRRRA